MSLHESTEIAEIQYIGKASNLGSPFSHKINKLQQVSAGYMSAVCLDPLQLGFGASSRPWAQQRQKSGQAPGR